MCCVCCAFSQVQGLMILSISQAFVDNAEEEDAVFADLKFHRGTTS